MDNSQSRFFTPTSSNDPIRSTSAVGENCVAYFLGGVEFITYILNESKPPQTICQKYENIFPVLTQFELILVTDTRDEKPIPKKYYICIVYILYDYFFFFN